METWYMPKYPSGGERLDARLGRDSTRQPESPRILATNAPTAGSSVASSMVTRETLGVSVLSIAKEVTLSGAFCDISRCHLRKGARGPCPEWRRGHCSYPRGGEQFWTRSASSVLVGRPLCIASP